uniref:protein NUCLEAR FUSION DEFECTIVE 6, mitochondrial-like isoform X1 n=1 Tax=Erigeron canadensis TaxID=72917 RepID=UPI001CB9B8CC|nr:protein NUCLEAR FUSION DEFECTIVE 6, mitochondrial-like isoform X1 [Erigeron canadensis]XP_043607513.1 protein NUCLEAR FUSION DEFECTIVE 6, mitochondrial-like isoform X2 [Erigeron canadensis]
MSGAAIAAVRSFTRSTSVRSAAARLSSGTRTPIFRLPSTRPRIFRRPVELSACLETVLPFHTVTASALMTSMLHLSHPIYASLPEGS